MSLFINADLEQNDAYKAFQGAFPDYDLITVVSQKRWPELDAVFCFDDEGEVQIIRSNGKYTADQIYDIVAFLGGAINECEAYWYEEETEDFPVDDFDPEDLNQRPLGNYELDARYDREF